MKRIPLMILDLTHPIIPGMPVYPGDRIPSFTERAGYGREGYLVHDIAMSTHTGTHIDAPVHYLHDGIAVDRQPVLDACVGPARVIDAIDTAKSGEITVEGIEALLDGIGQGDRILLATGWSARYGSPGFFSDFPSVSAELATWCAERKIALLGVETPSLSRSDSDTTHRIILSAGIVIVESLANLSPIAGKSVFFSAAPLALSGLDGSPVRAYAVIS
jgi:kynurenine formamidase